MLEKFNKNCDGYCGESVDADLLLTSCIPIATSLGFTVELLPVRKDCNLLTLRRVNPTHIKNIYISAGIHGDEPAPVIALQRLLEKNSFPSNVNLFICPCLNPSGLTTCNRTNSKGIDQNRDYVLMRSEETRAHVAWLETCPRFDIAISLHEDWEANGFYLYEEVRDTDEPLGSRIIEKVASVFPIDTSEVIDGFNATNGIIQTSFLHFEHCTEDSPDCPEAIYLFEHKTNLSYTLETGSDFPLENRVEALIQATLAACRLIEG